MKFKFLTPKEKIAYMNDFNNFVLKSTDEYWKLDDGLSDILININKNKSIQTLYSKHSVDDARSYLMLAIDESYLEKLDSVIVKLKGLYTFDHYCNEPSIFKNDGKQAVMSCNSNKKHFNTSVFVLDLHSDKKADHKLFWKIIKENLV